MSALAHTRCGIAGKNMKSLPAEAAGLAQPNAHDLVLTGFWTARGIGAIER
jgi:hypothetical protein